MSATLVEPRAIPARQLLEALPEEVTPTPDRFARHNALAMFHELCLAIYPEAAVERHKSRMKTDLESRMKLYLFLSVTAAVALYGAYQLSLKHVLPHQGVVPTLLLFGVISAGCVALMYVWYVYWGADWVDHDISAYRQKAPIPEVVEAMIEQLERCPQPFVLRIEALKADPLLAVWLGGVCYVPAMWEKPGLSQPLLGQS